MRKIKGLRWYMIALVTLGTVLGYLTRNTVAAAAPTLMEELKHLHPTVFLYHRSLFCCLYGHATGSRLCTGCAGYENRLCNVCCAVGRVLWCNRAGR